MTVWVYLASVSAFIGFLGWCFWGQIGSLYDPQPKKCAGCQRHFVKPGCPVHDEELRKVAA